MCWPQPPPGVASDGIGPDRGSQRWSCTITNLVAFLTWLIRLAHLRFTVAPPAHQRLGCATPRAFVFGPPRPYDLDHSHSAGFDEIFRVCLTPAKPAWESDNMFAIDRKRANTATACIHLAKAGGIQEKERLSLESQRSVMAESKIPLPTSHFPPLQSPIYW